jgi:hypothetical protein
MPAGTIQDEDDLLLRAGPDDAGKRGQLHLEQRDADRGGQVEGGTARGRMDEANEGAPHEAVLYADDGSASDRRPDATEEGFQANAVLVGGPQLDGCVRQRRRHRPRERSEVFLTVACCSASAKAWRGRGTCGRCRRRTR